MLMENNKFIQTTLPKGRIGFSSLDVVDGDEPKYQIRSPYELKNAIIPTDERHNDCFLLHSLVPPRGSGEFLQIVYGTENSILQPPNSIGHCISADARVSKGFADFLSHKVSGLRSRCREKLIRQCQSSVSDDQATSSKRNKTNFNKANSMVEVSYFLNFNLAPFWWYQFYFGTI